MAGSLIERLRNIIRDNLVDFLEVDSENKVSTFKDVPPQEIARRLKLRLGAVEAERYRLTNLLADDVEAIGFDMRANEALDAGDEHQAKAILRLKVDHTSTRAEAIEKREDLDREAEDLHALTALIENELEIEESLEKRLESYEAALRVPTEKGKEG